MSELETRQSESGVVPDYEPAQAQTAEIAPIGEIDTVDIDTADDDSDVELLAIPPRADDLGTALAARPPRVKLPKVTTALACAVLICAGFIGGVLVQKHLGGNSSTGGRANFSFPTGARGGGTGGGGGFFGRGGGAGGTGTGGFGGGGNAITGTVTVVSGDKLYVTAADGSVYTVSTTGSTTVNVTNAGTLSQLKPGQSVVISGTNDGGGNVTADSITANSAASK